MSRPSVYEEDIASGLIMAASRRARASFSSKSFDAATGTAETVTSRRLGTSLRVNIGLARVGELWANRF